MPILGKEAVWGAARKTQIESQILISCGQAVQTPNCIEGLANGLSFADIPFLINNLQVEAGQVVTIPVTSPVGTPSVGTTTSPGTVT